MEAMAMAKFDVPIEHGDFPIAIVNQRRIYWVNIDIYKIVCRIHINPRSITRNYWMGRTLLDQYMLMPYWSICHSWGWTGWTSMPAILRFFGLKHPMTPLDIHGQSLLSRLLNFPSILGFVVVPSNSCVTYERAKFSGHVTMFFNQSWLHKHLKMGSNGVYASYDSEIYPFKGCKYDWFPTARMEEQRETRRAKLKYGNSTLWFTHVHPS